MITWLSKELREMVRLGRWIPLFAVYILLGAMQPIAYKLMPTLLAEGNLPKGTVIQIPLPTSGDVLAGVISQYNQLGVLALILVGMGMIAGEHKAVGDWLWSKPIVLWHYVMAKFIVLLAVASAAILVGFILAGYYTDRLIGAVAWDALGQGALFYIIYAAFLISVILFASTVSPNPTFAGGLALILLLGFNLVLPLMGSSSHFVKGLLTLTNDTLAQLPWTGTSPSWEPVVTTSMATLLFLLTQVPLLKWQRSR